MTKHRESKKTRKLVASIKKKLTNRKIKTKRNNKIKSKNIVKGFGLIGLTAAAGCGLFLATFSLSGDIYFGP